MNYRGKIRYIHDPLTGKKSLYISPRGINSPHFKSKVQKCDNNCGKDILVRPNQTKRSKTGKFFCSPKCSNEWKSKHLIGDKIYNFRGGYKNDRYYGPGWTYIRKK